MYNQGLIFKEVAFFINSIKNFIFIGMDTKKKARQGNFELERFLYKSFIDIIQIKNFLC